MTLIELLESKDEALNVQQVAELLGISKKKVYQMAATGKLPSFRIGKAVRFDAQDLAEWLRKKKHLGEQLGPGKVREGQRRVSMERNGKMTSPDHVWRKKVNALETALAIDGLSGSSSVKAS
jgi:excisionase family DNA binding protein